MERTSLCVACEVYGAVEIGISVDPACRSRDEADALCTAHRARMTEGCCVLCGRRAPWVSPWAGSRIGACRRCYGEVFGVAQADAVAEQFKANAAPRMPEMADRWKAGYSGL